MTAAQPDLFTGKARRDRYLASHEEATGYLTDEIDRRLVARVDHGEHVTVDAAHPILEEILEFDVELGFPEHKLSSRTFLANVFTHKPHWVNTGRVEQSKRPSRNAGRVTVWRLDESKLRED